MARYWYESCSRLLKYLSEINETKTQHLQVFRVKFHLMKEQNPKYHHPKLTLGSQRHFNPFQNFLYKINCNIILPSYCWSRSLGFSRSQQIPDDSIAVTFETSEFHSILTRMTARYHFMSCARCKRFKSYAVITSDRFHHKIFVRISCFPKVYHTFNRSYSSWYSETNLVH